jgi:hypothetical protein
MWSFGQETLIIKRGICADTAILATSLLIADLDAWCCLGEVRKIDDTLLGYHAWTVCPYENEETLMETTVHTLGSNTLVKTKDSYDKVSAWAANAGLYYVERARFNSNSFIGDPSIVASMSLPANRVLLFGLEATRKFNPKQLRAEWKKEEKMKTKLLQAVYKNM